MTHQRGEQILFEGEPLSMFSEPLESYFDAEIPRPPFTATSTSCARGYVGTWEIDQDRLFLTGLQGWWNPTQGRGRVFEKECTLKDIFPEAQGPVLANWYSGELRIVKGECLEYVHFGYKSVYETEIFLTVQEGRITGRRVVDNTASGSQS